MLMIKDLIVMLILLQAGLFYLFYSASVVHQFPYFMVATFVLFLSIGLFFIFLRQLTREGFVRLVVVNSVVVILIPIVEGMDWLGFTILY